MLKALPNGSQTATGYDPAGQVLLVSTSGLMGLVSRHTYTYDRAGRRDTVASYGNGATTRTSFSYDAAGQLVGERCAATWMDMGYEYDPAGNRAVERNGGTRTTSTFDAADQLVTQAAGPVRTTFTYDGSGNLLTKVDPVAPVYYAWDAYRRLIGADPVGGPVALSYGADGQRVGKDAGGLVTQYIWDQGKLLQEADGSGATRSQYLSCEGLYGDLVSGFGATGRGEYYGFDALGSVDAVLDDTGTVTARVEVTAFGITTGSSGPGLALPSPLAAELAGGGGEELSRGFVGRQQYVRDPETELYLLGGGTGDGRYYYPPTARFLSRDPQEERGGSPNLYLYCANDPVNNTDPSGQDVLIPEAQKENWEALADEVNQGRKTDKLQFRYTAAHAGYLYLGVTDETRNNSALFYAIAHELTLRGIETKGRDNQESHRTWIMGGCGNPRIR